MPRPIKAEAFTTLLSYKKTPENKAITAAEASSLRKFFIESFLV